MPLSRPQLLDELTDLVRDYRHGDDDVPDPSSERTENWVNQFPGDVQNKILQEMAATLKKTYFSRTRIKEKLREWCRKFVLNGEDPKVFWEKFNFLDIQQNGHSQKYMLQILEDIFQEQYGFGINDCGNEREETEYVYLDDGIFTGSRIRQDMMKWFSAPGNPAKEVAGAIRITVIVLVLAKRAEYDLFENENSFINLVNEARKAGLNNVTFETEYIVSDIENRKYYVVDGKDNGLPRGQWELLRPEKSIDDPDVQQWLDSQENRQGNFQLRANIKGRHEPFSSAEGRELLETEFVKAGVRIIARHQTVRGHLRPLGFHHFDWGFGAMFITHRNCPNNCPLALWWGLGGWTPLLPRKTYPAEDA